MKEHYEDISILIVDDDSDLASSVKSFFELEGFNVVAANTPGEAEAACRETMFDIAFVDLALPEERGDRIFARLKEIIPRMQCVIITGNASLETAIEAVRQEGVVGYEVKPFDMEKLMVLVHGTVSHVRAQEELETGRQQLRALSHKIITTQEEERARLSRELHDNIGKFLTALALEAEWLTSLPEVKRDHLSRLAGLVDNASNEVRNICRGLRPMVLDDLGLTLALISLIREHSDRIEIIWTLDPVSPREIPDETAICFYRVLQEGITNILKHSGADTVKVDLKKTEDALTMWLEDNGRGIPPVDPNESGGLGLIGMRERAELCGGSLSIVSVPSRGTCITMKVPFGRKRGKRN